MAVVNADGLPRRINVSTLRDAHCTAWRACIACICHVPLRTSLVVAESTLTHLQGAGLLSENQARMNMMRHTVQKLQTVLHVDRAVNNTEWLLSNRSVNVLEAVAFPPNELVSNFLLRSSQCF
jgi:hypothetical protein